MTMLSDLTRAIEEKQVITVKVGEDGSGRKIEPHILFRALGMGAGMQLLAMEVYNPNVLSSDAHWETYDVDKMADLVFVGDSFTVRPDFEEQVDVLDSSVEAKVMPDM